MKCPACPADRLPEAAEQCPACSTDLRPIQRIRAIPLGLVTEASRLAELGALDVALARLAGALSLQDSLPEARKLLARLLIETGRPAEALRHLKRLKYDSVSDPEVDALIARGQHDRRTPLRVGAICVLVTSLVLTVVFDRFVRNPIASLDVGMAALSSRLAELDAYRRSHTVPDETVQSLQMDRASLAAQTRELTKEFSQYRMTHSISDTRVTTWAEQLSALRTESARSRAALDVFGQKTSEWKADLERRLLVLSGSAAEVGRKLDSVIALGSMPPSRLTTTQALLLDEEIQALRSIETALLADSVNASGPESPRVTSDSSKTETAALPHPSPSPKGGAPEAGSPSQSTLPSHGQPRAVPQVLELIRTRRAVLETLRQAATYRER